MSGCSSFESRDGTHWLYDDAKKLKFGERVQIVVTRDEEHFDRACHAAYRKALVELNVDDNGNSLRVEGADKRSTIHIKFESYERTASPVGHSHAYFFSTWVEKEEDD